MKKTLLSMASAFLMLGSASAQQAINVSLADTTYSQNFNTLKSGLGTGSAVPSGWDFFEQGPDATFVDGAYNCDAQHTDPGAFSLGDSPSTPQPYAPSPDSVDRAFGGQADVNFLPTVRIGAKFKNNETADTSITSMKVTYRGETWKQAGSNQFDTLKFFYSTTADSLGDTLTTKWTSFPALDYIMQVSLDTTEVALRNYAGNYAGPFDSNYLIVSARVENINVPKGQAIWLRWQPTPSTGTKTSLAGIDNFDIKFSYGVAPTAISNTPTYNTLSATMYPNPATTEVRVSVNGVAGSVDWYITNTLGQTLRQGTMPKAVNKQSAMNIEVNTLPVGNYFMYLRSSDNKVHTLPFTKIN